MPTIDISNPRWISWIINCPHLRGIDLSFPTDNHSSTHDLGIEVGCGFFLFCFPFHFWVVGLRCPCTVNCCRADSSFPCPPLEIVRMSHLFAAYHGLVRSFSGQRACGMVEGPHCCNLEVVGSSHIILPIKKKVPVDTEVPICMIWVVTNVGVS